MRYCRAVISFLLPFLQPIVVIGLLIVGPMIILLLK
jgi:hypothetical protein